jgi:GT2 family glycosyltransferase
MATLGLVTVLFNSNDVLEGFFKSLSLQIYKDYHLYLIDNTSSDVTDVLINTLSERFPLPQVTHIKNECNVGVAEGNNQGIQLSISHHSMYTLLLNNDIEFNDANILQSLIEEGDVNKEMLIIPKILFFDSRKIWMAGGRFIFYKGITNHIGEGENDGPIYNREQYFNYAPTCFMLINNLVFENIGLMDDRYFVYFDDTDFTYRAFRNGYRIKYSPKLTVLHKVSSLTGGSNSLFTLYFANRNRIFFIRKNFKGLNYLMAMTFTVISRGVLMLKYKGKKRSELLRAIRDGFKITLSS